MTRLSLCLNCLDVGASPFPVGPEKGSQRDPYHDTVDLCTFCKSALSAGDFEALARRHTTTRTITLDSQGGN